MSSGLTIKTNTASLKAQRALNRINKDQGKVLQQLASGLRINKASDDAAGLGISEKLKAEIRGLGQAERNANDGISLIQIAEGGIEEVSNILTRMKELSVQASSDTIGNSERSFSDLEYQNLKKEVERVANVTNYNGLKLLNGDDGVFDIQIGTGNNPSEDRIQFEVQELNSTLEGLGIASLSVDSKKEAQKSLGDIDKAIHHVSSRRAFLGAQQNRLSSTIQNVQASAENLSEARSRIVDTDFAKATAENTKNNILLSAGTSVLSQANSAGQLALKLLS